MLTENVIHKVGRIDQIVRDYFIDNPFESQIRSMDLMELFIEKGVFNKDYSRPGLPIRNILRQLDKENKLSLLKHCHVVRNPINRNWFFTKLP